MTKRLIEKRYECLRKIGEGGMAVVYEARDRKLNRMVAVKILHEHMQHREDLRERFIQEARSVSKLKHSNILEIYDFSGEKSDELWVVTELLDGIDLSKFVKDFEYKRLDPILASCIVREIALALDEAHSHGIIHRDIKPSNIMFTKQGRVKLMDFGIAKDASAGQLTQTGTFMGSPSYMSPEQIRGSGVSFSSDIYSLCVLFYELVTGRVPFRGSHTAEIITKIIEDDPIPPKDISSAISPSINEFILKGLEKKPEYRFERTNDLESQLAKILKEHGLGDSRVELEVYSKNSKSFLDKIKSPPLPKKTQEIPGKNLQFPAEKREPSSLTSDTSGIATDKPLPSHFDVQNGPLNSERQLNTPDNFDQRKKKAESNQASVNAAAMRQTPQRLGVVTPDLSHKGGRSTQSVTPRSQFSTGWVLGAIFVALFLTLFAAKDTSINRRFNRLFYSFKDSFLGESQSHKSSQRGDGIENPSAIVSESQTGGKSSLNEKEIKRESTSKLKVTDGEESKDKKFKGEIFSKAESINKNKDRIKSGQNNIDFNPSGDSGLQNKNANDKQSDTESIRSRNRPFDTRQNNDEKSVKAASSAQRRSSETSMLEKDRDRGLTLPKPAKTESPRDLAKQSKTSNGSDRLRKNEFYSKPRNPATDKQSGRPYQLASKTTQQVLSAESKYGQLYVSSNTNGILQINGKKYGVIDPSGKVYQLPSGSYEIKVSKTGYKNALGFARVENGKTTKLADLNLEPENNYKLIILSDNTFEVELFISSNSFTQRIGISKGTKVIPLPAGTYNIKAVAGNKSLQRKITLPSPFETDGSVTFTVEIDR